jgi:hypothetical protein
VTAWLVFAPSRTGDDALLNSAWIAAQTIASAPHPPAVIEGSGAVRAALEAHVRATPELSGLAFFGHGARDRLFDASRSPADPDGPAAIDTENVHLLRGCWIHAFACLSGVTLAERAVVLGATIYVGYRRPLDVGWTVPPPAEREFIEMVTCVTLALLAGERDERKLLGAVSRAVDAFFLALEAVPDVDQLPGWMWLHKLGQDLVDALVVVRSGV